MKSTWWCDETELDEQQKEVIRIGVDEGPILITGQPGSGKTNLALLRANYLILSGLPRTVVLTMGKVISNFIYAGAQLHGLQKHNVMTFHAWGKKLIIDAGESPPEATKDYAADLVMLVAVLRELASEGRLEPFDAILLDEAQDYPKGAAAIFESVTARLFITGDRDQQIHDKTTYTMREFNNIAKTTVTLKKHYRNGHAICRLAGAFRGMDYLATSGYDEEKNPSRFERKRCTNFKEEVYSALVAIPNQSDAYPEDLIGLIVPTNAVLDKLIDIIDDPKLATKLQEFKPSETGYAGLAEKVQLQHSEHGYSLLDPKKPIIALNAFNSKGLEFRSCHFLGVDAMYKWPDKPKTRNLLFTVITRAKTSLDVYHSADLPYWIESPIRNITEKPKPPSKLSSLFPPKAPGKQ